MHTNKGEQNKPIRNKKGRSVLGPMVPTMPKNELISE